MTQVEHVDGRVELIDLSRVSRSPLYNEDLAPVPLARRTWTTYNYAWFVGFAVGGGVYLAISRRP